jgi:hypothetical protein
VLHEEEDDRHDADLDATEFGDRLANTCKLFSSEFISNCGTSSLIISRFSGKHQTFQLIYIKLKNIANH